MSPTISQINGRAVLQPKSNQVPSLERRNSPKKTSPTPPPAALPQPTPTSLSPPLSPKLKSPRLPPLKRGNDPRNDLNSSAEKFMTPRSMPKWAPSVQKLKRSSSVGCGLDTSSLRSHPSSLIVQTPGKFAAARREQVAIMQEQRKSRIAHYGRSKSVKYEGKVAPLDSVVSSATGQEKKRCTIITPNSDPVYVAYHDEEWGVAVHDDKLLFELLLLTGAQVGSDWTSILKKRQVLREAFAGFDAETVAKYTEKKMASISADYGLDLSLVRGAVDNSTRILEVTRESGSFAKYLWGFVNHKPINNQYKSCHKIPLKTSKSETISKDMVRRGFRFVGPTVMHSFMQAAGLTNDHLITCPRYLQCLALASHHPIVAPDL
ncbi:Adenine_glyco domain-containing protein [Cephalotus follicularis]|uniref:Adenine_glyco domain-containing protein n=1 Tax=Cephalotus follicularis TaxID=3775 RepID=A0A1Q3C4R7_CEPFO|nr:Adenine_glyco domain-containing protein [Cephalotus follicularis]